MEKRIQYLEACVIDKDKVIRKKSSCCNKSTSSQRRMKAPGSNAAEPLATARPSSTSDFVVATAELGLAVQVHDWVSTEITLLHEEDDSNLEVDVATVTIAQPDGPWFVTSGQFYMPFGVNETNLASNPLTLEIVETRETALQPGFEASGFSGSFFGFNGTNKDGTDNRIDNFGLALRYAHESDALTLAVITAYINDIGDSDNLETTIAGNLGSNNLIGHVGG